MKTNKPSKDWQQPDNRKPNKSSTKKVRQKVNKDGLVFCYKACGNHSTKFVLFPFVKHDIKVLKQFEVKTADQSFLTK